MSAVSGSFLLKRFRPEAKGSLQRRISCFENVEKMYNKQTEREVGMKKYRVNVNGTTYEVEVEEISGASAAAAAAAPAAPAAAPAAPAASAAPAGGEQILSPMPGNILDVRVNAGDAVKAGQVLMILEAMKMENEIMAPHDGKVASVSVKKGDTVEPDTLLCVIE